MKKIIDGLRYDTEIGVEIGSADAHCPRSDFNWWEATLYHTPRSGRYFLAGEGGPMTAFSAPVNGNMRGYGERIIPMSAEDALEWAEQHLTVDEVEAAFGDQVRDA
jgi:hypothetical protein